MEFYEVQRFLKPLKAQRTVRNLIFLISETQHNFRNKLFNAVKVQLL